MNKKRKKDDIKHILCPICEKLAFINIKDKIITIKHLNNKDSHISDLNVNELINNQYIDESNIICGKCPNNKNLYNDFYICSCGINICPLCKLSHNSENHNIIEYNKRNNLCVYHNSEFISYCENCKMNLCYKCEDNHSKHKGFLFKSIYPSNKIINENKNNIKEIINKNNKYKNDIENIKFSIIEYLNFLLNNFNDYNKVYEFILNLIENIGNYVSLMNVINLKSKKLN